jgi:hypothetical protein
MPELASEARVRAARLSAHGLRGGLESIEAAVRRLGAVQAQDYAASRWVLGARVPGSVAADVDRALEHDRTIVRSWPMRGTLHVLPTEWLRPILAITGPRLRQKAAARHRELEIDDATSAAARTIAERELAGGIDLSRDDLQERWEAAGIRTDGQRGYHLIWLLANDGVLCCGPVDGRGQRFALLDEWAPARQADRDDERTLAELFTAYARGHGPVTVRDFAWWTGLTLTHARTALAAAGVAVAAFDDERWVAADAGGMADGARKGRATGSFALAAFDEYFLGYADRTVACDPAHVGRVVPGGNGVFQPILVSSGRVVGTWHRGRSRAKPTVALEFFDASSADPAPFAASLGAWARFHGLDLAAVDVA